MFLALPLVVSSIANMFCPLCEAEYRDGFATCSDCRVALVHSPAEARSGRRKLWKGDRQTYLDRILKELDSASIPSHFKELVNLNTRARILGIPIGPQRSTFEYEVWVFRADLERARMAIKGIVDVEDSDD
jgi:hypothetical protein